MSTTKVVDGMRDVTVVDATKLSGNLPAISAASLTSIPAGNLTGTVPTAALSNVDLGSVRSDIATLALHSAIADNKAAYNLPNSFIDQFQDDTGIGTETDGDRNASEYWDTVTPALGVNSNTKILLHMDDASLSDSSGTSTTTTRVGAFDRSSTQSKFGGYSGYSYGSTAEITFANVPTFGSSLFGLDFWWRATSLAESYTAFFAAIDDSEWFGLRLDSDNKFLCEVASSSGSWQSLSGNKTAKNNFVINTWYHIAVSRVSSTEMKMWVDGGLESTFTIASGTIRCNSQPRLGEWGGDQGWEIAGYIDEYRLQIGESPQLTSGDPLYISSGTGFTAPTTGYSQTVSATGTLISTAQTANAAQTKVSGVILYKNNEGTATLGTDLKIYFTCNGGTNWTESTPVAAGTFSAGILMAKCPEVTCTSGTDVRYKAVWANQANGSKETQLHGVGMNY